MDLVTRWPSIFRGRKCDLIVGVQRFLVMTNRRMWVGTMIGTCYVSGAVNKAGELPSA